MSNAKKNSWWGLWVLCVFSNSVFPGDQTRNRSESITITPARSASAESTRLLAELAQPANILLSKGDSAISVVRSRCGIISKEYLEILQKENPEVALEGVEDDVRIIVPACFVVDEKAEILVLPGDSLSAIAKRNFGSEGSRTLKAIVDANQKALGCGGVIEKATMTPEAFDGCIIQPGQKLILQNVPVTASYLVRSAPLDDISSLQSKLSYSLKNDSLGSSESGFVLVDEELVASAEANLNPQDQCLESEATEPYPKDALFEVLRNNDTYRELAKQSGEEIEPNRAVIVIADTGLFGFDSPAFPRSTFRIKKSSGYASGSSINYGINVYQEHIEPKEWKEFSKFGHGTHVAGLARGGADLSAEEAKYFSGRVRLLIASMLDIKQVKTDKGASLLFSTPSGGIRSAAMYAVDQKADILSISFTSKVKIVGLSDVIKRQRGLLVVAAAGNEKNNTDYSRNYFPHSYGGVGSDSLAPDQVIVVAAHQRNGKLAPFSSFGRKNVDLAAPGCRVRSNSVIGGAVPFSGTSEATPSVSLIGALIKSEGIEDARHVKARIVSSLDRTEYLEKKVAWGGKLNAIKALSLYDDVLELKSASGRLLFGRLEFGEDFRLDCGEVVVSSIDVVSKIYRNSDVALDWLHVLLKGSGEFVKQEPERCEPKAWGFKFHVRGESEARSIEWSDVQDLVPRYFRIKEV